MTDDCCSPSKNAMPKAKKGPQSYNWSAIGILIMFAVPLLFTGAIYVSEIIWPVDQNQVLTRKVLVNCYTLADSSKLSNIDSLLRKYQGREQKLLARIADKYPDTPECSLR